MDQNNDYFRNDIRKDKSYIENESGHDPDPQSSLTTMEMFQVEYKRVNWQLSKDIFDTGVSIIRKNEIAAIELKKDTSFFSLFGSNLYITGRLDFDFSNFSHIDSAVKQVEINLLESEKVKLNVAWSALLKREYSFLNMSLTLMVDDDLIPMSQLIPVFLYNLNKYFAGESHQLFELCTNIQKDKFIKYLDSAFVKTMPPNRDFYIEDYCRKVLFIEDPQLIRALLDFGVTFQERLNAKVPVFLNVKDVYQFIDLVTWYWAEKETNILIISF